MTLGVRKQVALQRLDEITDRCAQLDAEIAQRFEERDRLNAEGRHLRGGLPKMFPKVVNLQCTDCPATFDIGTQLTDLLRHTMAEHGRRPNTTERTPVEQ